MKKRGIKIIISAILFVLALVIPFSNEWINNGLFIISYLVVGCEILKKAVRNIFRGKVFDENFLMAVATIGAFAIGEFPEAVAVMLFYQVGELFQSYAVDKSRKSIASLMDIRPDYANIEKDGKVEKVEELLKQKSEKGKLVFVGDGINDAPVLTISDIGVAMGMTGTEVAKDAAAMVLTDDNFATIVKAVENGRNLYQNIKYAIQFLLSGNFGAILTVLCSSVAGLPVPFAPVHLLFINLLTDSLPAIALGLEPDRSEVMSEKPRLADESILTKDFLSKIGLEGLVIGAMTMISFLTGYNQNGTLLGSTYAFGTLCLARLFHGYNCKSDHPVIFTKGLFHNKWLQGAFVLGAVLITTVLTVPGFHNLFKVETLNLMQLGCVYLYAFASLLIIQLLKCIRMKLRKRGER